MADIEKVMKGLDCCAYSKLMDRCDTCPYQSGCRTEEGAFAELAHDALMMVKTLYRVLCQVKPCSECVNKDTKCKKFDDDWEKAMFWVSCGGDAKLKWEWRGVEGVKLDG